MGSMQPHVQRMMAAVGNQSLKRAVRTAAMMRSECIALRTSCH